ncbi:LuxR C-terminal-related transcriptional regulator [Kribbella italica]|uniref:DNA-binding CsgD family transcriptional regulator n=1 Tax=Kribbella italica TaxID=1540520 RepID=A0A7W9J8R3_9ACTN|nr:LuxR C-terminal-related transcriptional regulator [Kribbella italica]MBB5837686.1 DNA-binding CsgD family transcriptional regulator [Kribbella italica]
MENSEAVTVLTAAARLVQVEPPQMIAELSETLATVVPHRAVANLTPQCAGSPLGAVGDPRITSVITGAELAPFIGSVSAGRPWQGEAQIGGTEETVLTVASDHAPRGSVLAFVLAPGHRVADETLPLIQALWDVVTAHFNRLTLEIEPSVLAQSRAVAMAREVVAAELSDAHTATLAALLGVLRNRQIDDAAARTTAVDLALNALADLRTDSQRDRADAGEEPAGRAFQRLADSLQTLLRHLPVELELDAPSNDRLLPSDLAHAARVAVRAAVLAMLGQDGVRRIRVGWRINPTGLQATVRDDGPGVLDDRLDLGRIAERLRAQGGRLDVEAVPGWGLTLRIMLPVALSDVAKTARALTTTLSAAGKILTAEPLAALGQRELEVLERLAQGHRNRVIADNLHISESTVKYHVANILTKLAVTSRTEAAALYLATASA